MEPIKNGPYSPHRFDVAACRYAFHRLYIAKDPAARRTETLPQARGSAVHIVLARITEEILAKREKITDDDLCRWTAEALAEHPVAIEQTGDILRMATTYFLKAPPEPLPYDTEVEKPLAAKWDYGLKDFVGCDYDDPEAYIRGRADVKYISDDCTSATIIDHKTQRNVVTADTLQLGIYAWIMKKTNPFLEEVRTILYFAQYGYYSEPYVWTSERLAAIEKIIKANVAACETDGNWVATPHDDCQYCPFVNECPAVEEYLERDAEGRPRPKMSALQILGDTYAAARMFGAMTVLEEVVTIMKRLLRGHAELSKAPIAIPGRQIGHVSKENVIDWDHLNKHQREEVYAIFKKHGVDPKHFMGFSETFSKKIWQAEKPKLSEELNAILRRETKTEFRAQKV